MSILRKILLILLMSLPGVVTFADGKMPSGEGTKEKPYLLANFDNLEWFREQAKTNGAICAKLTMDIEAPEGKTWYGIGPDNKQFTGTFDGDKHTITGLKYETDKYTGSFGFIMYLGTGGIVKNLILEDCNFSCSTQSGLGGVCGSSNQGIIDHCAFVGGKLTNKDSNGITGLICGSMSGGSVNYSYTTSTTIDAYADKFGTIAGVANNVLLNKCFSMAYSQERPLVGQANSVESQTSEGNVVPERFASGEVTWKLSEGDEEGKKVWRQNLQEYYPGEGKSDELPVFTADHEEVYRYGEENKPLAAGKFTTCWYLKPITLNKVTAYIANGVNQNNVTLEQVNSTEKNIPYVLYSQTGGTYSLPICYFNKKALSDEIRVGGNNLMVGQVKGKDIVREDDCVRYVLQTQNEVQALYKVGATKVTAANFKCYMEQKVANDEARTSLGFSFGEPTGIEEIQDNQEQMELPVNIMGQRVGNATRGIYIINGKKFLAR